ncbi:MAG: LEPR-XLL domain-containing protein, partial [Deltaproteobacteria bacterium]|nr:LEPR-XLL domain-containing protein [Deltaproteobacteria bacterium]
MSLARQIKRMRKKLEWISARKRHRKAMLEALEPRLLLSADLSFTMSGSANDIKILLDNADGTDRLLLVDNTDDFILHTQLLSETSNVEIFGSEFDDDLTIDMGSSRLLEDLSILFTDASGADSDLLKILGGDRTWDIIGTDTGSSGLIDFTGIENLAGGPDNQDTFVFHEGGSLSGALEGGFAGFDSLVMEGGNYDMIEFTPASPDSGTVNLDGNIITYTGLEPVLTNAGTSTDVVFNMTGGDDSASLSSPTAGTLQISGASFETTTFSIPTGSVTINGQDGNDSVTVTSSLDMPTTDLMINAESIKINSGMTVMAGDITFNASATDAGLLSGWVNTLYELSFADDVVLADADARIDLTGATLNGNNITLNATSNLDIDTDGFPISSVSLAVIYAESDADVILHNTNVTADGNLAISATSKVTARAVLAAHSSSTDSSFDAAVAISYIDSSASVYVSGTSNLTVSEAVTFSAENTVTSVSLADGSTTGTAGAALAMNIVKGTTKAYIAGTASIDDSADADEAESIAITATSVTTAATTAKSAPGGATSGSATDRDSQKQLTRANASTGEHNVNVAAAVAITDIVSNTQAYIKSGGVIVSDNDIDITASSANRGRATADGISTNSSTGIGVGVALNFADVDTKVYIGGAADLTASTITGEATIDGREWGFNPTAPDSAVNLIDNSIDLGVAHGFKTGDAVIYSKGGETENAIGNLTDGETYYIIVDETTPNLVKLATSAENAEKGTAIDLTAGATGDAHKLSEKSSTFVAEATSGAGASSVGVAGSLALNVVTTDADAYIESGAIVNVNGASLDLSASSKTQITGKAMPKEGASGESVGIGASVALNIGDNNTRAEIRDLATVIGADDINLSAEGSHKMTTQAKGGAEGGIAITPVVAISLANNDTIAQLGTAPDLDFDGVSDTLVLTGELDVTADHSSTVSTKAAGDATSTGSAAVGASLALSMVVDQALATTARSISAEGNINFQADSSGSSKSDAKASAKGGKKKTDRQTASSTPGSKEPENVDQETGNQRTFADNTATSKGASTSGSTSTPSSSSSDGPVTVAAAISVNMAESTSRALIPDSVTINAGGALTLSTTNNTDAIALADGSATKGDIGIGAAVAVNSADVVNEAYIGGATVNAEGVSVQVTEDDQEWTFSPATAVDDYRRDWSFDPSSAVSASNETITIGGSHGLNTGDVVEYKKGAEGNKGIGGLTDGGIYYVILEGTDKVKLAKSAADAQMGTAIDLNLTDTSGSGHKLVHFHDTINIGADHGLKTGDLIVYDSSGGNSIGGLKNGEVYYVIADESTPDKVKLAASVTDAAAGKAIDLDKSEATGTGHELIKRSTFMAAATAGAGAKDVSVAGALGLNIVNKRGEALIKSGATVSADGTDADGTGSDVTVTAENRSINAAAANSKVPGKADVGVGASVALNIFDDTIT